MKMILRAAMAYVLSIVATTLLRHYEALNEFFIENELLSYAIITAGAIVIFFTLAYPLASILESFIKSLNRKMKAVPPSEVLSGAVGALIGLAASFFVIKGIGYSFPMHEAVSALILAFGGSAGYSVAILKFENMEIKGLSDASANIGGRPKILDTSVIIDGRILDVMKIGFIEGKIIIPTFILEELRHIADSSDALKRNRGRLGLDVLNNIKEVKNTLVEIVEWSPPQGSPPLEVDIMLLKIAQEINGCVLTNDLNLNKVAELHKVPVLNINELSNAVKSVVLPGQEMTVFVVKEGKEYNQGVAYLNDGTMIVIEDGKKFIDSNVEIIVTSVLQTPAGRMVFGKYKDNQ